MPNTFPTLSSGACYFKSPLGAQPLAKYPLTNSSAWVSRVIKFVGDQEQSWVVRPKLASFTLEYKSTNGYDVARLVDFFNQMTGRYVDIALLNTFTIVVGSDTFNYCVFDQDAIEILESPDTPNYFDFTIHIRQLRPN